MTRPLPAEERKRKNFTPKTKRLIRERSNGTCEVHLIPRCMYPALPESCSRKGEDVDHITPDWCDGPPTMENGALLCKPCHSIKTVTDNKTAKKSARLRGETGQQKRLRERGHGSIPKPKVSELSKDNRFYRKPEWPKRSWK